jgi:hypothetical protein
MKVQFALQFPGNGGTRALDGALRADFSSWYANFPGNSPSWSAVA